MDEYNDEAVDALNLTMLRELRAALTVEDGDPAVADAILEACHLSPHVWARLDDTARQDVAWALRSAYLAGHRAGYYDGWTEANG